MAMGTSQDVEERWNFLAEWPDPLSGITRKFSLRYFPKDRSVEMLDTRTQRLFLRRSRCESLLPHQVALGARVLVLGRELRLVGYGDPGTAARLERTRQRTLLLLSAVPSVGAVPSMGLVLEELGQRGLRATRLKMVQLTREQASDFFSAQQEESGFSELLDRVTHQPLLALEMEGEGALKVVTSALADLWGATVATPGIDPKLHLGHASSDAVAAERELAWFFPEEAGGGGGGGGGVGGGRAVAPRLANTARLGDVTCCVVKPHALTTGYLGKILGAITEAGFEISAMGSFVLDRASAEEFYEVYKGVVPDYSAMVSELCSGPCVAMEVREGGGGVVGRFRELCGPADPEVGRELRPESLRAQLGSDKLHNVVHCTDLAEDGELEVEYFFRILDS